MKRIIGLLTVIIVFAACKKNQPSTTPQPLLKEAKCITLEGYDKLVTNKEKAEWLVKQGNMVCDSILYAREVIHEVAANEVKVPSGAKPFMINWTDFQKMIGTTVYENYVGVFLDDQNNVSKIAMVPEYREEGYTYSAPMFRSIGLKYNLKETAELEFVMASVKDKSTVVIRFKNEKGDYIYYDFYDQPL